MLVVAMLCLLLLGCGFQPRGSLPLTSNLQGTVAIAGLPEHHEFQRALQTALNNAGVETSTVATATQVIKILSQKTSRLILSVDSRGKTIEYELQESVHYVLASSTIKKDSKPVSLMAKRILYNPGEQLLGRNREERLLRKDMYHELSRRLIQQLAIAQ